MKHKAQLYSRFFTSKFHREQKESLTPHSLPFYLQPTSINLAFHTSPSHHTNTQILALNPHVIQTHIYEVMANQTSAALSGGIPWDQLIKFANEKKAEEEKSGRPAQLNQQQIIAISQLIDLVHDIEVEDKWVGELNSKLQYKREATRCAINSICLLPRILPAEQVTPSDIRSGDLHFASLRHKSTAISGHLHHHFRTRIVP